MLGIHMTEDEINAGIVGRIGEFVAEWDAASADRHAVTLDGGRVRVFVSGLRAGRVEIGGEQRTPIDLAAHMMHLTREAAVDYCAEWLGGGDRPARHDDDPPEARPTVIEPAPAAKTATTAIAVASVNGGNGSYLPDIHRPLPQSPDAEKGVLCSFMLAPAAVAKLCEDKGLRSPHFHIPAHATIFDALTYLHGERMLNGDGYDAIPLTQFLHDTKQLDAVGGSAGISAISTFIGTAANASQFIDTVLEKRALREAIRIGTEIKARAYEEQDQPWAVIEDAKAGVLALGGPRAATGRLPGIVDLSALLGEAKPPEPPELVRGLLHQGSKLIIGGTSKGRKTFSLLDLAISVATGTPWWGMETVKGRVCYINFEIQTPFFARRTEDICRAKKVELEQGMLMGWMLRGHSEGIELMMAELLRVLLAQQFALIIFDPIYKALGNRDENKAGDVASMLNELERIAVKTGAAIAFGAHYSKGNQAAKESIDRIGGSGVFARDPDAILAMTAHENDECFVVECTLRNFKPLTPFVVKWEWPLFTRNDDDPTALKQPGGKGGQFKPTFTTDMLTEKLSAVDGITVRDLKKQLRETEGMSEATFWRLLKELRAKKEIDERDCKLFRKVRTAA